MRAGLFAALALASAPVAAQQVVVRAPSAPVRLQVDAIPMNQLVGLLMRDVMQVPYVISSEVLADSRLVSVNLTIPRDDIPVKVVHYLRSLGLTVTLRGGTVYVTKGPVAAIAPAGQFGDNMGLSPVGPASAGPVSLPPAPVLPPESVAIVRPAHRSVLELTDVLAVAVPGALVAARRASEPQPNGAAEIVPRAEPDELVISGNLDSVALAVELVKSLDKPRPMVQVRAVVFEVRTSKTRRSALSALMSLGPLKLGSGDGLPVGDQFVRIATGGLSAVLSATNGDGRFKIVAEPALAILSGSTGSINSGADVPTIGAVTFAEDGSPVRSVVYRSSGLSMTVTPRVRGGEIELVVVQERSAFVRTQSGVNDSPTLTTSRSSSTIAVAPGETIAISGLDLRSNTTSRSGFLGGLIGARSKEAEESQLLLVLQADTIGQARHGETVVVWLGKRPKKDKKEGGAGDLGPLRKPAEQAVPSADKRTSTSVD